MLNVPEAFADTSRWSFHVDDAFYGELDELMSAFAEDWTLADALTTHEANGLLVREARLLDLHRFEEWLTMFTADCLYWVPVVPGDGDPRKTVSHAFDDRRRLEDRVFWLNTGLAYSQLPPSRTVHCVSNVEVRDLNDTTRLVRSTFTTHEVRTRTPRTFSGWTAHVLSKSEGEWRIKVKQVNLLDSDAGHENLTLVL